MLTTEVESRTQGSRPRPRTQKKSEAKAKDSLSEDRTSRGQEQECSRPRPRPKTEDTGASILLKKKVFKNIFQTISNSLAYPKFLINSFKTACHYIAILAKWLPDGAALYCHSKFTTLFPAETDVCMILIPLFNWMHI